MAFKVRLLPSGREFEAVRHETVLEAALRAGLSPSYGCHAGNCGACKGRLIAGELAELRFHDYVFGAAERQQGYVLLCRAHPASDLVIEAAVAGGVADIPTQTIPTKVAKLERLQADIVGLHLRTPRSRTLRFLAGQHLRLEIAGLPPRSKSIASCPCQAMQLEFHIRHVPADGFAEHVFTRLKPGDAITVVGPWGDFSFHEDRRRPVIFLAYETGFAPIKSLIEQALAIEFDQPMHLYWVVAAGERPYLENYCRALVDALDTFRYTPVLGATASDLPERDMLRGARAILADHPDLAAYEVYANGPPAVMGAAKTLLLEGGLPAAQLHIDAMQRY